MSDWNAERLEAIERLADLLNDTMVQRDLNYEDLLRQICDENAEVWRIFQQAKYLKHVVNGYGLKDVHRPPIAFPKSLGVNSHALAEVFEQAHPTSMFQPFVQLVIGDQAHWNSAPNVDLERLSQAIQNNPDVFWASALVRPFVALEWRLEETPTWTFSNMRIPVRPMWPESDPMDLPTEIRLAIEERV